MIAVLDQRHRDIAAGQPVGDGEGGGPGHGGVLHAVQQPHGQAQTDGAAQPQMAPAILDQGAGDAVAPAIALDLDRALRGHPLTLGGCHGPPDVLGEIGRGGDADQPGQPLRALQRQVQHDPAAHAGADQNLRPRGQPVQAGQGIVAPAPDGAGGEGATGLPVAQIVEAQKGLPAPPAPGVQKAGLGARHVGGVAAQPHDARCRPFPPPEGQALAVAARQPERLLRLGAGRGGGALLRCSIVHGLSISIGPGGIGPIGPGGAREAWQARAHGVAWYHGHPWPALGQRRA